MLCYDAMDLSFERVPYRQRDDCPVCGDDPVDSIDGIEYSGGCRVEVGVDSDRAASQ
jgi:adenylyltransferase/sulfurtransferase